MAKQTLIQLINKVQDNLGEVQSSSATLASLSGISLLIFNTLNEALYDIATEYRFNPLETNISIPLVAGTATYTNTYMQYDKDSFKYTSGGDIEFYTAQKFDREYPVQTNSGTPKIVYDWGGYFNFYPIPSAGISKTVKGRAWSFPTPFSTASSAQTCWIPEGFDLTLLCDYVTYKVLHYRGAPEWQIYYNKVYGNNLNDGSMSKLKAYHGSPMVMDGSIMVEPFNSSGNGGIVQPPILG